MKVIELADPNPTLDEIVDMAQDELVVLRRADGTVYALSQVDDFDVEVELLRNNPEFMAYMKQLSEQEATISLQELRKELGV